MKRILVLILSIISLSGYAQTVTGNKAKFRTSIELADYRIVYFDNDTNLTANSQSRLVTQYALKKYIDSHGGGVVPGANNQVIFNDNGNLGADTALTFAKSLGQLYLNKGTLAVKGLSTTSATRSLKLMDSNGDTRFAVLDNGMLEIGKQTNAATQNTAVIKAAGADANIGIALTPIGNGAFSLATPGGTVTGGNARGQYAVDLQMLRVANTQVASGQYSTAAGGVSNTASGQYSTVAGGVSNTASGYSSTVAGGYGNTASGGNSFVGGGHQNAAQSSLSSVINGQECTASANGACIISGYKNVSYFPYQVVLGSSNAEGSVAQATSFVLAANKTGTSSFLLKGNDTRVEGGGINWSPLGTNRNVRVTAQVIIATNDKGDGSGTTGDVYASDITFTVKKVSNNISILASPAEENKQYDSSMSDLAISVTADNATKEVKIQVTPPVS